MLIVYKRGYFALYRYREFVMLRMGSRVKHAYYDYDFYNYLATRFFQRGGGGGGGGVTHTYTLTVYLADQYQHIILMAK